MALRFRPLPGLTVAVAISTALLIGLGVWQVERLHWKLDLIATMDRRMHAAPMAADGPSGVLAAIPAHEYDRVLLSGHFDNAKEAYLFTTDPDRGAVYHVLTPFISDEGHVFVVDRGMVPVDRRDPKSRSQGQIEGETSLIGIWRTPDAPGFFTPAPDLGHHVWYARDLAGIAAADRIALAAPVMIEAGPKPNLGGWPLGGQTVVDLPNNHLSYIFTWFGLAAGLIGVYLAYHVSKGRLSWS